MLIDLYIYKLFVILLPKSRSLSPLFSSLTGHPTTHFLPSYVYTHPIYLPTQLLLTLGANPLRRHASNVRGEVTKAGFPPGPAFSKLRIEIVASISNRMPLSFQ